MFSTPDELSEGQFEIFIKASVQQRVDKGVDISKPGQEICYFWRDSANVEAHQQLLDEKGQPGQNESTQDQSQNASSLSLPCGGNLLPVTSQVQVILERRDPHGRVDFIKLHGWVGGGEVRDAERLCELTAGERVLAVGAPVAEVAARTPLLVKALGSVVDPVVQNQDQSQRYIKCPECGVNSVDDVIMLNAALAGNIDAVVISPKQRGHGYENGDSPHGDDHQPSPFGRPFPGIFDGICDCPVPVQSNDTQVKNRTRAAGHVDAKPDLTDEVSQSPFVYHYVSDTQGHDKDSNKEIRHS